jgi:hypothetical protein
MNSLIFNGVPFDSAQGTPFIDFLGFHCVLKRTVLVVGSSKAIGLAVKKHEVGQRYTRLQERLKV